jgi:hypothetical protein
MTQHRIIRLLEYIGEPEHLKRSLIQCAVPLQGERDFGALYVRSAILGSFPEQVNMAELSPYNTTSVRKAKFTELEKMALQMAIDVFAEVGQGPTALGALTVLQDMLKEN